MLEKAFCAIRTGTPDVALELEALVSVQSAIQRVSTFAGVHGRELLNDDCRKSTPSSNEGTAETTRRTRLRLFQFPHHRLRSPKSPNPPTHQGKRMVPATFGPKSLPAPAQMGASPTMKDLILPTPTNAPSRNQSMTRRTTSTAAQILVVAGRLRLDTAMGAKPST